MRAGEERRSAHDGDIEGRGWVSDGVYKSHATKQMGHISHWVLVT